MIGIIFILGYLILGTAFTMMSVTYCKDEDYDVIEDYYIHYDRKIPRNIILVIILTRSVILSPIWFIEELIDKIC